MIPLAVSLRIPSKIPSRIPSSIFLLRLHQQVISGSFQEFHPGFRNLFRISSTSFFFSDSFKTPPEMPYEIPSGSFWIPSGDRPGMHPENLSRISPRPSFRIPQRTASKNCFQDYFGNCFRDSSKNFFRELYRNIFQGSFGNSFPNSGIPSGFSSGFYHELQPGFFLIASWI